MHKWGIRLQNNFYESSLLSIMHTNLTEILLYKPIMCSVYVKPRKQIQTLFR